MRYGAVRSSCDCRAKTLRKPRRRPYGISTERKKNAPSCDAGERSTEGIWRVLEASSGQVSRGPRRAPQRHPPMAKVERPWTDSTSAVSLFSRGYLRGACACRENRPLDGRRAYDGLARHCGKMSFPRRTMRTGPSACAHCGSCPRVW